jgi:hypothetical protein
MLAVLMLDKSFIFVKEVGILPWVCEGLISSFRWGGRGFIGGILLLYQQVYYVSESCMEGVYVCFGLGCL